MSTPPTTAGALERLLDIMRVLRTPDTGCPWDLKQDHATLTPYILEEAHEVVDAIETGSDEELVKELGDLLLQIVFHAQIASERDALDAARLASGSPSSSAIRQSPHAASKASFAS